MLLEALKIAEEHGFGISTKRTGEAVMNDYGKLKEALGILKEYDGDRDWKVL